ncbi:MAG TPA: PglZ domain-containing protein [Actinomycetota bacterium]|nr:PglZ domain-containing protein [Actinomycetota bacterium]
MTDLRDHLRSTLAKKVQAHGLVVWEDPDREYAGVVQDVVPEGAVLYRWDGSWYRLRRDVEGLIGGPEPPRLIVYQPAPSPPKEEDPLAEVREAGTVFRLRLRTLLREAMGGNLTEARIDELARAKTLEEVEAGLGGAVGTGVRLPALLGTADPLQLCLRLLADEVDLPDPEHWEEARAVLRHGLGGESTGEGQALRDAVFRHLVLVELREALDRLPPELEGRAGQTSAEQRRRANELLRTWRADLRRLDSYRGYAHRAEADLDLATALGWDDRLAELDTVPLLEDLAFRRMLELIGAGDLEGAERLGAARRRASVWVRGAVPEAGRWAPLWDAALALVELRRAVALTPVPTGDAAALLEWYGREGWRVDRAHRRMESSVLELATSGELAGAVVEARAAYEAWLEGLLERFTAAVEAGGLGEVGLRQSEIHARQLGTLRERTAYVLVDALRYELGLELADVLRRDHPEVDVVPAVASAPTITPVGMASLLPGAELEVRLDLGDRGDLEVVVDGTRVRGVPERLALLRAAHGEVADLTLSDVLEADERELSEKVRAGKLILLRSQEIDEAFETGEVAAWTYVKTIRDLLARAVARLRAAGVERFVLASDHGFLILSREVGSSRVIDRPRGRGVLHRRCFVGKGGETQPSTVRVRLADLGMEGDLDLVVPRGLAIFAAGGARRFFHGGLSPQELLIPVIVVQTAPAASVTSPVHAEVPGGRITTGVFSAALTLDPNLFSESVSARVVARSRAGVEVARPIAGQGFDEAAGTVELRESGLPQIVTFQVVRDLKKGDRVTVEIYESPTDRLLAKSKAAEVAVDLRVGDELD